MGSRIKTSFTLLSILLVGHLRSSTKQWGVDGLQLPCEPQWRSFSTGANLPPDAIASHPEKEYVARVVVKGQYKIGSLEATTGLAYVGGTAYGTYQILTNPFKCDVVWISGRGSHGHLSSPPLHAVQSGTHGEYVGRSNFNSIWLGGTVQLSRGQFIVGTFFFDFLHTVSNYEILTTFSPGLHLSVTNFESKAPPPPLHFDYLGMSLFENNGDGDVIQTVTHTKSVTKVNSVTHSHSTSHTATIEFHQEASAGGSFLGIGGSASFGSSQSYTYSHTSGEEETASTETSEEVSVSDQIVVPAHTSIEVCSVVSIVEGFSIPFTASATYTGRGMTGEQVQAVLVEAGVSPGMVDGDRVLVDIDGQLGISSALNTKIIVLPVGAVRDCNLIATEIVEDKKRRMADREKFLGKGLKSKSEVQAIRDQSALEVGASPGIPVVGRDDRRRVAVQQNIRGGGRSSDGDGVDMRPSIGKTGLDADAGAGETGHPVETVFDTKERSKLSPLGHRRRRR